MEKAEDSRIDVEGRGVYVVLFVAVELGRGVP